MPGTIRLGLYSAKNATASLTATVTPPSAAGQVSFSVSNSEATITATPAADVQTSGIINLVLTAASATPASANPQTGDAQLVATSGGQPVGTANVLVLEPAQVIQPTGSFSGTLNGVNVALGRNSTPSDVQVPVGKVSLRTGYEMQLTVQVADQFGNNLDSLFSGTPVTETVAGQPSPVPINETLSASGTYTDNVGFSQPTYEDTNQEVPDTDTSAINVWLNKPPFYSLTQDPNNPASPLLTPKHVTDENPLPVQVGGHNLNPTVKRDFTVTPTGDYTATLSGNYD